MDIMKMGKNPNFLGAWDLDELPGREIVLTIDYIRDEKVVANGKDEMCTVAHWVERDFKPMILNVTNKKALCKLYKTKDTDNFRGKAVIIGVEQVKAFGDIFDALRIRKRLPPAKTEKAVKCEVCGDEIKATGNMTAVQVAAYTKKKYGKALCSECATKLANAVKGDAPVPAPAIKSLAGDDEPPEEQLGMEDAE